MFLVSMLQLQEPLSQGVPKKVNPTKTTSTVTDNRKGDTQHVLRGKNMPDAWNKINAKMYFDVLGSF